MTDIADLEDFLLNRPLQSVDFSVTQAEIEKYTPFLIDLVAQGSFSHSIIDTFKRKHKFSGKNSKVFRIYNHLIEKNVISRNIAFENALKIKSNKSESGVIVITVVLSPYPEYIDSDGKMVKQAFTCEWNCYYCPNEPGQPRSYLKSEPAVQRANQNQFDPILQVNDRIRQLEQIGHLIDKIELIVLGGTWESYPIAYREQYIRDLFYAANVYYDPIPHREKRSLPEEQALNETGKIKIVALKLETRPDTITADSLKHLRYLGCTHIQIGVQHLDNSVLKKINRQAYYKDIVRAIKSLKDCGFKIDIHIMPMLPGSSYEMDVQMFDEFLGVREIQHFEDKFVYQLENEEIQADEWKIYPCQTVPWTVIQKWYLEGKYEPYSDDLLKQLIVNVHSKMFPWIRLNRVIRDIPVEYVIGGTKCTNLRQVVDTELIKEEIACMDIRSREVKGKGFDKTQIVLVERMYGSSGGTEIFLSFESPDYKILYGLLRLRLTDSAGKIGESIVFPELQGAALIRQVHVYGKLVKTSGNSGSGSASGNDETQHNGLGSQLIQRAIEIAKVNHNASIAVIASVGTRNYYKKFGFQMKGIGQYMILNF